MNGITLHKGDLPAGIDFGPVVAVDTEAMGLNLLRDNLNFRPGMARPTWYSWTGTITARTSKKS